MRWTKRQAQNRQKDRPKRTLGEVLPILESIKSFDADSLKSVFETHAESKDQKVFAYFRAALRDQWTRWRPRSLPMLAVMGRERVVARIKRFIG